MARVAAGISRRKLLAVAAGTVGTMALAPAMVRSTPSASVSRHLLDYDAVGLAELVRAGEVTPVALVQAAARRITALDGDLNAMTTLTTERALELATRIPDDSVFAGVPTVLKDLVDLGGVRRTDGSMMNLANVPTESVDYVKAMETAGLNILGMTNTPEFASLALTDNAAFGATRNPWNLKYSAGGSSGGSGAAVAAAYVPIAHGTDGGGSNRIPASCCGLLGMKASRYRQVSGEAGGGHQFLRTHQCLSRTVRDSAALLAATEDRNNQAGYKPVGLVSGPGSKRLRIAVSSRDGFGQAPDTGVQEALDNTVTLCQSLGHTVVETANPVDSMTMFQALEGVMLANMPGLLAMVESLTGRSAEEAGLLTPSMVAMGRHGASQPSGAREKGLAYFRQLTSEFAQFYGSYDVWLTPTMPMETPLVGYIRHDMPVELLLERNRAVLTYTAVANGIGAPAMSVPLFHSTASGLPVGSMFMAAPGADRTLYELAFELEASLPWSQRWAPHSAMSLS